MPKPPPDILTIFQKTKGFMPTNEGLTLYEIARKALKPGSLMLEIGTYCGKSTTLLGSAAKECGAILISLDHHRGSEENQVGQVWHDPELFDPLTGKIETLHQCRRTLYEANLESSVILAISSSQLFANLDIKLDFLFIDGGHSEKQAFFDYGAYAPKLIPGGILAIHDVFENPEEGGRPPYLIFSKALEEGFFQIAHEGSLRILRRTN